MRKPVDFEGEKLASIEQSNALLAEGQACSR